MPRFRKVCILASACAIALLLALHRPGSDTLERSALGLPAALAADHYDLGQLPILTRTLYQVNEAYYDKTRFDQRRMLVGALDHLERAVPEILVDRLPEADPRQVRVRVASDERVFDIRAVDSPWSLRSTLQEIFRFVQPRIERRGAEDESDRLLAVEVAATNGLLSTLDPHSALLDVDSYREMRTQTEGRFGGVGMSLIDDPRRGIVVRELIPNTPAVRAGILARDRIVRIDNESTVNMTVTDAVVRLRGEVGKPVDIYIERPGSEAVRKLTVVREMIRPSSIENARVLTSRSLPGQAPAKIGYFRIESFSATTEPDMLAALERFEQERVKGLIIDLRDNPGGLYEQAFKVADAFIGAGTLVSMVGVGGSGRRNELATAGGNVKLPLAVLVDGRSASASEIVAAALKNLDRAVIIGDTTFGKGSVQILFDIPAPAEVRNRPPEDARLGLKLTTAQYLTPGDRSIQGVGVSPDLELNPLRVEKRKVETFIRLQKSAHRRQESDLEWSLQNSSAPKAPPAAELISYLHVPPPGLALFADDEDEALDEDEAARENAEQAARAVADLAALANHQDFAMELARDLLAQSQSVNRRQILAGSSAFFARVRAEQDEKVKQALEKLGVDWSAGDPKATGDPAVLRGSLSLVGNARVRAGETARIRGVVKNTSAVAAHRVRMVLKSANLLLDENEMVFGRIGPQETRSFELALRLPRSSLTRTDLIQGQLQARTPIRSSVAELTLDTEGKPRPLFAYTYRTSDVDGDGDGRVERGEKVRLTVTIKNIGPGPSLRTEATLRNGPGQPGILITAGRFRLENLAPGASRDLVFKYQLGDKLPRDEYELELTVADTVLRDAVTDTIKVQLGSAPAAAGQVTPPVVTVSAPTVTSAPTVRISGRAVDDQRVRDLFIQVFNRDSKLPPKKVFYLPNRGAPGELPFQADVPVRPGSNFIQLVARETDQVTTVVNLVVLQKPATPRTSPLARER